MRITIRHYFDFGEDRALVGEDLVRPEAWDALRTRTSGPFSLPEGREEWLRTVEARPEIERRALEIDRWLKEDGDGSVVSYGVGGASLELWLHRLDRSRPLVLTDYAPATVERLRRLFPEATVRRHNLLVDPPLDGDVHLFHRIDTEFSNREWREIFRRFRDRTVVVVATELIDLRRAVSELRRRRHYASATRAGLIRNRDAFESLWTGTHHAERMTFADLHAWSLSPRTQGSR